MALKIYLNGEFVESSEAKVSVFDHGLLYGDGVFEGIRSYDRKVFRLGEHIERLYESAGHIKLNIPLTREEFEQAVLMSLKENDIADGYVRAVVTRGPGDLGLDPRKCPDPTVFIIADKIKLFPSEYTEKGLKIVTARTRRTHPATRPLGIKSLNYLNNILGKIEAIEAGVPEVLMLTLDGYICEGSGENIFFVKNGELFTPSPELGALAGITQKAVMELAGDMGVKCSFVKYTLEDLKGIDECFLTGTAAEIIPVVNVDGADIGTGKVGDMTRKLTDSYRRVTRSEGVTY